MKQLHQYLGLCTRYQGYLLLRLPVTLGHRYRPCKAALTHGKLHNTSLRHKTECNIMETRKKSRLKLLSLQIAQQLCSEC